MQMEAMECGAASLGMILAYYGKWVPLETLREECGVSRDGQKLSMVVKAAKHHGLEYRAFRYRPETIYEKATFPCIIHWKGAHFAVLCGIKGDRVFINDPGLGHYYCSRKQFEEGYSGMCVMFSPTEEFVPSGKEKKIGSFLVSRLAKSRKVFLFTAVSTLLVSGIGLLQPEFLRTFLDRVLNGSWFEFMKLSVVMLAAALIQLAIGWYSAVKQLRLFGLVSVDNDISFMKHILHLPERFFFQRDTGDLQQRQIANSRIAETMTNLLIPLMLNSVMIIFYAIVMFTYSPALACAGYISIFASVFCTNRSSKKRLNINRIMKTDVGKLYSATTGAISMFETIKASGAEANSFTNWSVQQENVIRQQYEYDRESIKMRTLMTFISDFSSYFIFWLGIFLITSGSGFTIGTMIAFYSAFNLFLHPIETMVNSEQLLNEMKVDLERVDDVMNYPEYHPYGEDRPDDELKQLSGNIEIKNISFGYSPLEEPLVQDFSLTIKPGQCIAIVGRSGCGKSTVSSLISGLYEPWGGEILYDGKPISVIPKQVFRSSLAVVSQNSVLFKDTIENNIKLWNPYIETYQMVLATRNASIYDEILEKPGGYIYQVSENGNDFSGGERQRIEIARALAGDPSILILDEATSALDAMTEYEIVKNVRKLGITCIVVAHRLSTIRDCDEILVMDRGRIIERGKHEELMEKEGYYAKLISSM